MGTNISQGAGVCNTSKRGTLLFFRNFIFIFFLITWCIKRLNGALFFWRIAIAKNLKVSSNDQGHGHEYVNNARRYSSLVFSYLKNFSLVLESFNVVNVVN